MSVPYSISVFLVAEEGDNVIPPGRRSEKELLDG
jgi:hypothetical protein